MEALQLVGLAWPKVVLGLPAQGLGPDSVGPALRRLAQPRLALAGEALQELAVADQVHQGPAHDMQVLLALPLGWHLPQVEGLALQVLVEQGPVVPLWLSVQARVPWQPSPSQQGQSGLPSFLSWLLMLNI